MQEKKITPFNDNFDTKLFGKVIRNNLPWLFLFAVIAFTMAFLYLRYTYPIYESKSIIQIALADKNSRMLLEKDLQLNTDLPSKVELLKSSTFLERVFNKLPLDVSYYQIGNVLNFEMYKTSPFEIEYRNPINELYTIPLYITFTDENNATITTNLNNKENVFRVKTKQWVRLPIVDSLKIDVKSFDRIRKDLKGSDENPYYFVFTKRSNLVRNYAYNLKVEVENSAAGTIKVLYYERNPDKAADICNTVCDEFKVYDIEKQAESANNTIKYIDDQLKNIYDKLYDSEVNLQNFKAENRLDDETPLPNFNNRIEDIEKKINDIQLEELGLQTIENAIVQEANMDVIRFVSLLASSDIKGAVTPMLTELRELIQKKSELLYSVTPNSSKITQLDYQIDIQKKLILETLNLQKIKLSKEKIQHEDRLASYEEEIQRSALSFDRIEFVRLQKLNSINESYYDKLVTIKSQLAINNAGITSENTVLEASIASAAPFFPSKRVVALSALIGWLVISLALVIIRYLFYNEITTVNDILRFLKLPVLGIVPNYKDIIPISQLIVDKKPKSIIAESLRSIRSNLDFLSQKEGSKIIAVTSTISGEGKTFVALNLAGIIAFSEKKVVILDLDMRKPKIHVGFGVPNDKGMSTILIGRNTIDECVYKSSLVNLDFITAGPVPPNPSELVISNKMVDVLEGLKERYDVIVIDNPPIGLVTDGIRAIKISDFPVYVFRENYSKRNFVQNVQKLVTDNNITNLSIIMNAVDIKKSGYGYSGVYDYDYGYGYGYGFGYYDEDIRRERFSVKEFFRRLINK
ncbi:MAG: polysaccharide biosynthesis tyrosine autokinase [Bacteroidia bacterium]|jgi:tyrosine-protein kinase Etk/Wzc